VSAFTGISRRNDTLILRNWSGRLFASFNPKTDKNDETGTHLAVVGYSVVGEIGSETPYARIHDKGGTIENGWGRGITINMPKRPYFTPAVEKMNILLEKQMDIYFNKRLKKIFDSIPEMDTQQFITKVKSEIMPLLNDLKNRIPFTAQGFIGKEMKDIKVNPEWKGVKGG